MLYFLAYSGLISGIVALVFGSFVYLKNRHSAINQSYGLLSLTLAIWGIPYFFWPLAKTKAQALLSFQLLHVGAILVAPTYLWFIFALLNIHKKFKKLIFASTIVAVFLLIFVPTRFFIKDMVPQYIFRYWAVPGVMYHLFLLFWFSCVFFVWLHLGIQYHHSSGSRKNQLKYVLIGTVLGILGGATNYLPWYKIYIPPVGTILVAVHVAIFAYAIAKYRLMDISVTITRAGIFLAVYALVLGLPFFFAIHAKNLLIQKLGSFWWLGPLVLMAGLGTTGPFVYLFLKNKAEGILLREQRVCQTALKNAAVDLTRIRNPQKIFDFIAQTITESVKISFTAIYFLDTKTNKFTLKSLVPARNGHPGDIDAIDPLIPALLAKQEAIVLEETRQESDIDKNTTSTAIIERMEKLYASVIVPCFLENRLLNIMVLGEKLSGKSYTQEDIDNFSILAAEVSLATENALLYEKIEDEVKRKTEELVTVQKELVHAEKLATVGTLAGGVAHEINNPLTAILTNVQMLLSDNQPDRESLEMIEEATKRCKTIVQKLMTFSQKPLAHTMMYQVNLIDIIQHTVNFLKFQLEQENITLEVRAEKDSYSVTANHDELGQVLTNLVLNAKDAIKQVKKNGTVHITVSDNKTHNMISVKDDGIGIPKEILNRIFDPFYTTKEVGKGLGLGLSICQTIIEKHKGKILVESQVNIGSTFTIQLPKFK